MNGPSNVDLAKLNGRAEAKRMTKREAFATSAMQGMLAYAGDEVNGSHHPNNTISGVAGLAVAYADALLAALEE